MLIETVFSGIPAQSYFLAEKKKITLTDLRFQGGFPELAEEDPKTD